MVGHGGHGTHGKGAVDREIRSRPKGHAYINFGDDDNEVQYNHELRNTRDNTKSNICEEGGDCADRVNEE